MTKLNNQVHNKYYPLGDKLLNVANVAQRDYLAKSTGVVREPMRGEWYLSGAIPHAYIAPNDLLGKYLIMKIVKIKRIEVIEEV